MTDPDDLWNLLELEARYAEEPSLKDIFVEGAFDQALFSWLAKTFEFNDVVVYAISAAVHIGEHVLSKYGLSAGERQRVIALSKELDQGQVVQKRQVLCIADRDFHGLIADDVDANKFLILTDFVSSELYLVDVGILEKFFHSILREQKALQSATAFLNSIVPIVKELFLIRLSLKVLELHPGWVPIHKSLKVTAKAISFDREHFLARLLPKSGDLRHLPKVLQVIDARRNDLPMDVRLCAQSHDFLEVCCIVLKRRYSGSVNWIDADNFRDILFSSCERKFVETLGVVDEIRIRFKTTI